MTARRVGATAVAVVVVALAACGGGVTGSGRLPSTPVEDLDGGTVPLSSLAPAPHPVLLWVWGPG